jgi:glycosyltransferase involved in cell wall biosynthesis
VREVHFVVPEGIDDPARPSGGNAYDRRVRDGLAASGWSVREHAVPGNWPHPDGPARAALASALEHAPDGAAVLLDGLVASTAPDLLVPEADRLRLVALVHMPLGAGRADDGVRARERAVLEAAAAVVTTSGWSRRALLELYGLDAGRVRVAEPGVDPAALAPGSPTNGALLCVGAVIPGKGHDVLLDALCGLPGRWRCVCVGSLEREPAFSERLLWRVVEGGLGDRVRFAGTQTGADLAHSYLAADVLVLPSRAETYGMVVTEALAGGVPVVASEVGGVPEAMGHGARGVRPGLLVPPGDPDALGGALRAWLGDAGLRQRLRRAARERRAALPRWPATAAVVARALAEASG